MRGFHRIEMKKNLIVTALISTVLLIALPGESLAWVGVEFDAGLAGIADPYEVTGDDGEGGTWELSGRVMFQENLGGADVEVHWFATALGTFGKIDLAVPDGSGPFRSLDLEDTHHTGGDTALLSELDRLSVTFDGKNLGFTAGRQAVSWGEAYYYNIGDLFGTFPVTETNRTYKTGIDALAATVRIGLFSDLCLVFVPSDDAEDSAAARFLFPAGPGSMSFTVGSILESGEAGAGYTVDIKGTKLYGTYLLTDPGDGDSFTEIVLGGERQVGPYTHLVAELYYNGWGAGDPDEYAGLILTERFLSGRALSLGKFNGVLQLSRQMSPLITITPAVFANISDKSVLIRMDGSYSASDLTSVSAGVFLGLGDRPDGLQMESEHGSVPPTLYVEVVHSL
jgi:hypothetical protein